MFVWRRREESKGRESDVCGVHNTRKRVHVRRGEATRGRDFRYVTEGDRIRSDLLTTAATVLLLLLSEKHAWPDYNMRFDSETFHGT